MQYKYVPEVLNVHMNEIYKKITTFNKINWNLKKLKKNHIFFLKSSFFTAWKKILKKVDFFFTFVHMNVQNFRHITNSLLIQASCIRSSHGSKKPHIIDIAINFIGDNRNIQC